MRVKDKVAIITGAGPGLGMAAALRFSEEGARYVNGAVLSVDGGLTL